MLIFITNAYIVYIQHIYMCALLSGIEWSNRQGKKSPLPQASRM